MWEQGETEAKERAREREAGGGRDGANEGKRREGTE